MFPTRLTRSERKAQTREALLDAGQAVFLRHGFHGASLERVAAEAGFTKGAVYAHFTAKADLFLAILARRVDRRVGVQDAAGADAGSWEDLIGQGVQQWGSVMRDDGAWSLLLLEFWIHAARDPGLRERIAAEHHRTRDGIAALVESMRARAGTALSANDDDVATIIMALGNGLNLDGLLFSDTPRVDLYEKSLQALLDGLR